ncbi:helix-turn-helix domain-containing protein [Paenibacillus sp. OK076]|uniref:helix-turn-helix domain-containing protein n=1 Tax=Paenibacillus sp. OK076 TaxID=1884379 RepID=UPI0008C86863|nr:helix-turn-helix transcriptional regulator [Paenibacillus sp. OK076]SEO12285.1 Cro/C1-type HTH DNA-binding domain-containing protein [Paenibacillus sp. OK076]
MGMTIGNNVQKFLDAKGWTPYRLGKVSGVSMTVIYGLKGKKQGPNAETLVKLATALDVTVDDLVKDHS